MSSRPVGLVCALIVVAASVSALGAESFTRDGRVYVRRPWGVERPAPRLTAEEQERGWVAFVPGEQDGIGPRAYPTRSEIEASLTMFACPGEVEPATFGVYASRAVTGVTAQAARLVGGHKSAIPAAALEIRTVRVWPQRTSWQTHEYVVIPELLEKRYEVDIAAGALQQYWLTLTVPRDITPGSYEGCVRVAVGSQQHLIPLRLRVLPFRLQPPAGKAWGLWPDTSRWRRFSDDEIMAELADWKSHGITGAMMYPLTHGKFTFQDGKLAADLSEFDRCMRLYVRAGLGEPVVASCQGLAALVHRLLGRPADDYGPEFADLATQIVRRIEALRTERAWPAFIYHTVDEPGGHIAVQQEARETLRILHEAGFTTFTTADIDFTARVLSPFLDVRCYSIGVCGRSAEQARARQAECHAAKAQYWWYGTGCYTGQEGTMAVNRHYSGFLFDKTGARGAWAWTFQRPRASAYDDFDGPKDACLTYPSPDGKPPLVPTLQWEGIREGVDDAKYLATLRRAIADLRADKRAGAAELAARTEYGLKLVLDAIPWLGEAELSSRQAQVARWKLAALLLESARLLHNDPTLSPGPGTVRSTATPTLDCTLATDGGEELEPALPVASAPRLSRAPQVDGKLDAVWDDAFKIDDLVAQDGSENRHRTEAWIARDARRLYVAFFCHEDQMPSLRAAVTEKDGPVWSDDSVEVFVDGDGAGRSYAHFMLNALGTRSEAWATVRPGGTDGPPLPADMVENSRWNPTWEGAAAPCEGGWCAELAIPLALIGGGADGVWSMNLNRTRRVAGGTEYGCWSPTRGGFGNPARFAKLALTAPGINLTGVVLARPTWGDNRLLLRVDNRAGVAEVEARAFAHSAAAPPAPTHLVLGSGMNEVELDCELGRPGANDITLELVPLSVWQSPGAAPPGRVRHNMSQGDLAALRSQLRPLRGAPLRLRFRRWLPAPLVVAEGKHEIIDGQPGFDVRAALNLGRRCGLDAALKLCVLRGDNSLAASSLQPLAGDAAYVNVGTAGLAPGRYTLLLTLRGPERNLATSQVSFTIIPGPWR